LTPHANQYFAAGNGIFRCRDERLKIGLKDRGRLWRPKQRNNTGENPRRNRSVPIDDRFRGLGEMRRRNKEFSWRKYFPRMVAIRPLEYI
jgi:hypothetical protein